MKIILAGGHYLDKSFHIYGYTSIIKHMVVRRPALQSVDKVVNKQIEQPMVLFKAIGDLTPSEGPRFGLHFTSFLFYNI